MSFEKVLRGIMRYLNAEIYTSMNDWQEVLARLAVSRLVGDGQKIKDFLLTNSFIKTFAIIDDNGNIDVDGLLNDMRKQISEKGKISISIPMFGSFAFTAEDIDKLHHMILEER